MTHHETYGHRRLALRLKTIDALGDALVLEHVKIRRRSYYSGMYTHTLYDGSRARQSPPLGFIICIDEA